MNQIMVDIEGFGTGSDTAVCAIGAVFFNIETGETGDRFYVNVDAADAQKHGMNVDANTVYWWLEQDKAAQQALLTDRLSLKNAIKSLRGFVLDRVADNDFNKVEMWSHATYDAVVLQQNARAVNERLPWGFRGTRDIRTLNAMLSRSQREILKNAFPRVGTHHNALDDAIFQVQYVSVQWNLVKNGGVISPLVAKNCNLDLSVAGSLVSS